MERDKKIEPNILNISKKKQFISRSLQLPTTMTAIRELLTYYKWDEQRLISEYFEYGDDPAAFFQQAKVANPFNIPPSKAMDNPKDCEICFSGVSPDVSSDKKNPLFCLLKTNKK